MPRDKQPTPAIVQSEDAGEEPVLAGGDGGRVTHLNTRALLLIDPHARYAAVRRQNVDAVARAGSERLRIDIKVRQVGAIRRNPQDWTIQARPFDQGTASAMAVEAHGLGHVDRREHLTTPPAQLNCSTIERQGRDRRVEGHATIVRRHVGRVALRKHRAKILRIEDVRIGARFLGGGDGFNPGNRADRSRPHG